MPTILKDTTPLERYGHNLTKLALQGAFPPLAGQEAVVDRVFHVLQRKRKCNPVIVASDETTRWAVMAEVVRRMAVGDAPDPFPKLQVIALDYEALFANLSDETLLRQKRRAQVLTPWCEQLIRLDQESDQQWLARMSKLPFWPELKEWLEPTMALERLQSMFVAMQQSAGPFLLLVDYFHRLLAGERERYPINAFSLLHPTLSLRQVQLIGACTLEQYQRFIGWDSPIHHCCQEVCLPKLIETPKI